MLELPNPVLLWCLADAMSGKRCHESECEFSIGACISEITSASDRMRRQLRVVMQHRRKHLFTFFLCHAVLVAFDKRLCRAVFSVSNFFHRLSTFRNALP